MFRSLFHRAASGLFNAVKQVCLIVGGALVALTVAAILAPFALGVVLLFVAKWAADRANDSQPLVVVPAGA